MSRQEIIHRDPDAVDIEVAAPRDANVIDAGTLLTVITNATRDKSIDLDRLDRLMALHERIVLQQREQAYNAALRAAQGEMPQVLRDGANSHTNSKYAKLETISAAMAPVLAKHGFGISFGTDASPLQGHYRITAEVTHTAGHKKLYHADIPIDAGGARGNANKSATHAFGSTLSYGRRYLKCLIFDVTTKGEDDDGNAAGGVDRSPIREDITGEQLRELRELLKRIDVNEPSFCAAMRLRDLPSAPATRFPELKHELIEFGREKGRL